MTNKDLLDCINACSKKGYSVNIRDIAYVLLINEIYPRFLPDLQK